jgi:hypothetical protein
MLLVTGFELISQSNLTSDLGWGCMLWNGKMFLARECCLSILNSETLKVDFGRFSSWDFLSWVGGHPFLMPFINMTTPCQ